MDMLSLLMNARLKDMGGDDIGEVVAVHYTNGKLYLSVDTDFENEGEDDPDGGEEVDGRGLDNTEDVPIPAPLRAVAGGKQ